MAEDDFAEYLTRCVASLAAVAKRPKVRVDTCAFPVPPPDCAAIATVLAECYCDVVALLQRLPPERSRSIQLPPRVLIAAAKLAARPEASRRRR